MRLIQEAIRKVVQAQIKRPSLVVMKHQEARYTYGRPISRKQQEDLKSRIRKRLGTKVKPRVRYKLTTVRTQYCGYVFTEWK